MNSNSSSWRSHCSSISSFRSNGESGAGHFLHILLKFGCFQPNINSTVSALTHSSIPSTISKKLLLSLQWPEEESLWPQAPPRRAHLAAAKPVSNSPLAVSPGSSKPASTPSESVEVPLSTSPPSSNISPPRSVKILLFLSLFPVCFPIIRR
jgi:hypothetical protein